MKKIITLSAVVIALGFCACNSSNSNQAGNPSQNFKLDTTKLKNGETFYQCEMNPEVISDKPGTCPTCGMELEKIEKK